MAKKKEAAYALKANAAAKTFAAPALPYAPPRPRKYNPPIALIGCGGISEAHLTAYRDMNLRVVALCDVDRNRAEDRRRQFFPDAKVFTDAAQVLASDEIEVVDLVTHPQDRAKLIPAALNARKHILSQKPFVMDLDLGYRFADLADKKGVKLAVNQNGRWSPYVSYARQAISRGLLGDVFAVHLACHWDHQWITATPFNRVHHIVLYDFAIHWFDMVSCYLSKAQPKKVMATLSRSAHQTARPPLLGQAMIEFDGAQASLNFDAAVTFDPFESLYITGTKGTIRGEGELVGIKQLKLTTAKGVADISLKGKWFNDGFAGAMGELLCSIEQKREPDNSAVGNLRGLALCFAAVVSAETGKPQIPGKVRKVPVGTCQVSKEI